MTFNAIFTPQFVKLQILGRKYCAGGPETPNPPMKFPLITAKTASEKENAAYSLSMNKTFPLNPLSEFEWTSLKTRMNVNLQPPCIHLHAYFISSVKSCIVQLYDAVCFHPSLDWARWNEMEICMLLHDTMPLKIKLWKFFTHFAMLTSVQHLHGIFVLQVLAQPSTPCSSFKISRSSVKAFKNRPNPNSLVCRTAKKFWRLNLKRRNILPSQEGGKTPATTKKPVHNVRLTVNFESLFELKYRQRRCIRVARRGGGTKQEKETELFHFSPTTARKLCLYLPCFVYSGLLAAESTREASSKFSSRANQQKYYLFVSLHIHAPPQSIKESRNVEEMERRGWEQQQTAQAGRKITCRRIRDDVWEENKLFRGNFLLCTRKGASGALVGCVCRTIHRKSPATSHSFPSPPTLNGLS